MYSLKAFSRLGLLIALLLLRSPLVAQADTTATKLNLVLVLPECDSAVVTKMTCEQLGSIFVEKIRSFNPPILSREDRSKRIYLAAVLRHEAQDTSDAVVENPIPTLLAYLKVSKDLVSIGFSSLIKEETANWISVKRRSSRVENDVERLAEDVYQELVYIYSKVWIGDVVPIVVRLPRQENVRLLQDQRGENYRQKTEVFGRSPQEFDLSTPRGTEVAFVEEDVDPGKFLVWKLSRQRDGYILKPKRFALSLEQNIGWTQSQGKSILGGGGFLAYRFLNHWSVRAGAEYYMLPHQSQVNPFNGSNGAAKREWREATIVPTFGGGYQGVAARKGVMYGANLQFSPIKSWIGGGAWIAPVRLPWLRLHSGYRAGNYTVEQKTFSATSLQASSLDVQRHTSFFTVGIGLSLTL